MVRDGVRIGRPRQKQRWLSYLDVVGMQFGQFFFGVVTVDSQSHFHLLEQHHKNLHSLSLQETQSKCLLVKFGKASGIKVFCSFAAW